MYCKNCGIINDEDAEFCKKCGFNLKENIDNNLVDNSSNKKDKSNKVKTKTKTKVKKIKQKPKKEKKHKQKKNDKNKVIVKKEMSFAQHLLMLFLFLLVVILFGALAISAYYIYENQSVEVPNVVNLSYEKAELTLAQSDLKISKKEKEIDDSTLNGIVIEQSKKVGRKVSKKSTIKVTVGVYKTKYTLQDFTGMELDSVKSILDINAIAYKISYEETDKYDSNIVLSQSPKKGTKLGSTDIVKLSVSKKISSSKKTEESVDNSKNEEKDAEPTKDPSTTNTTTDTNKTEEKNQETSTEDK